MKPDKIRLTCPRENCEGHPYPVPLYKVATTVVHRKCRKCGTNWVVKIEPVASTWASAIAGVHIATWRLAATNNG